MTDWGRALTQQTIDHADLLSIFTMEKLEAEVAKIKVQTMQSLLKKATTTNTVTNQLLDDVRQEIAHAQFAAMRVSLDYCRSYFYFNYKVPVQ